MPKHFGIEPEITALIAKGKELRIYEVGVSYSGRTYEEGKKITWVDGFQAILLIIKFWLINDSFKKESVSGERPVTGAVKQE